MNKVQPAKKEMQYKDKSKPDEIRLSNIEAAKAVSDAIRTSLGPKGMDKMIQAANGEVTITNDGATILKEMKVIHPAAKMLVELSKAQDVEAGDGTTSVVIIAGSLLDAAQKLLAKGIHPTSISESFQDAAKECVKILEEHLAIPIDLNDTESLTRVASTALNSKVVSQYSSLLAPIAVQAVMKVKDNYGDNNVDLRDIRIVKKLGGTLDDTELIEGLCLPHRFANDIGTKRVEKAKIGLIQFCVSPPKTDMDYQVIVSDYTQMDKILKEERNYILNIIKQVKKAGCNVLLIQKSILRDAVNDLAIHFLSKAKIAFVRDIEREDIEFICKALGCKPIASLDHFVAESLVSADCVEEVAGAKILKISGIQGASTMGKTMNVLLRGSNKMVIEEAERSIHDSLCVIRCLVKKQALVVGGGAPEIEMALRLAEQSRTMTGVQSICYRAFAEALEVIPYTLAENAGLNSIQTVTELRQRHAAGEKTAGINVRRGMVTNILDENVLQPLLVTSSAITLAAETVRSLLKIDDVVTTMR
ncbi:T-complex protein 1 subunit delta-like protein [Leptotrombidium deliense]|uniref:T-complex protein 1 subunit delta n=1 Tax=Leptotrombidium deliense TaxID=299467 RepID=A0A443S3I4_9ACAR|nr:T-complex protein 1 subunit delta-like protein [Leptotrombidium deliense]